MLSHANEVTSTALRRPGSAAVRRPGTSAQHPSCHPRPGQIRQRAHWLTHTDSAKVSDGQSLPVLHEIDIDTEAESALACTSVDENHHHDNEDDDDDDFNVVESLRLGGIKEPGKGQGQGQVKGQTLVEADEFAKLMPGSRYPSAGSGTDADDEHELAGIGRGVHPKRVGSGLPRQIHARHDVDWDQEDDKKDRKQQDPNANGEDADADLNQMEPRESSWSRLSSASTVRRSGYVRPRDQALAQAALHRVASASPSSSSLPPPPPTTSTSASASVSASTSASGSSNRLLPVAVVRPGSAPVTTSRCPTARPRSRLWEEQIYDDGERDDISPDDDDDHQHHHQRPRSTGHGTTASTSALRPYPRALPPLGSSGVHGSDDSAVCIRGSSAVVVAFNHHLEKRRSFSQPAMVQRDERSDDKLENDGPAAGDSDGEYAETFSWRPNDDVDLIAQDDGDEDELEYTPADENAEYDKIAKDSTPPDGEGDTDTKSTEISSEPSITTLAAPFAPPEEVAVETSTVKSSSNNHEIIEADVVVSIQKQLRDLHETHKAKVNYLEGRLQQFEARERVYRAAWTSIDAIKLAKETTPGVIDFDTYTLRTGTSNNACYPVSRDHYMNLVVLKYLHDTRRVPEDTLKQVEQSLVGFHLNVEEEQQLRSTLQSFQFDAALECIRVTMNRVVMQNMQMHLDKIKAGFEDLLYVVYKYAFIHAVETKDFDRAEKILQFRMEPYITSESSAHNHSSTGKISARAQWFTHDYNYLVQFLQYHKPVLPSTKPLPRSSGHTHTSQSGYAHHHGREASMISMESGTQRETVVAQNVYFKWNWQEEQTSFWTLAYRAAAATNSTSNTNAPPLRTDNDAASTAALKEKQSIPLFAHIVAAYFLSRVAAVPESHALAVLFDQQRKYDAMCRTLADLGLATHCSTVGSCYDAGTDQATGGHQHGHAHHHHHLHPHPHPHPQSQSQSQQQKMQIGRKSQSNIESGSGGPLSARGVVRFESVSSATSTLTSISSSSSSSSLSSSAASAAATIQKKVAALFPAALARGHEDHQQPQQQQNTLSKTANTTITKLMKAPEGADWPDYADRVELNPPRSKKAMPPVSDRRGLVTSAGASAGFKYQHIAATLTGGEVRSLDVAVVRVPSTTSTSKTTSAIVSTVLPVMVLAACGGSDKKITIVDVAAGSVVDQFIHGRGGCTRVRFHPVHPTSILLTVDTDLNIKLWRWNMTASSSSAAVPANSLTTSATAEQGAESGQNAGLGSTGAGLGTGTSTSIGSGSAISGGDLIRVWKKHTHHIHDAQFVPGQPDKIVSCSSDTTIKVWHVDDAHSFMASVSTGAAVTAFCFLHSGQTIVAAQPRGCLKMFKLRGLSQIGAAATMKGFKDVFISKIQAHPLDDNFFLVTGADKSSSIKLFDWRHQHIVQSYTARGLYLPRHVTGAQFSPCGNYVYVGSAPPDASTDASQHQQQQQQQQPMHHSTHVGGTEETSSGGSSTASLAMAHGPKFFAWSTQTGDQVLTDRQVCHGVGVTASQWLQRDQSAEHASIPGSWENLLITASADRKLRLFF